jgi:ATP-binding cassette subfamily B protein
MSGWNIIRSYIWKNRAFYAAGALLLVSGSMLAVMIPWLIGDFTDQFQHGVISPGGPLRVAVIIMALAAARAVVVWCGRTLIHRKGRELMYALRRDLFAKWSTLSPGYFHGHSTGDLLAHSLSDVDVVRELVTMGINVTVGGMSMLGLVCWIMISHADWRLTVVGLFPLLIIPFFVQFFGPRIRQRSHYAQEALSAMAQSVEEAVSGIRTVKAFGNEEVVFQRFESKVVRIVDEKMKFVRLSSLFGALIPLMGNLSFVAALGYGGMLAVSKIITLGDLVAFTLYITMLRMPLESMGMVLNAIQRAGASLQRLAELLDAVPVVHDGSAVSDDRPVQGELRVRHLTFRYAASAKEVLKDISFTVKPGQTLGIVGTMGSGKTTLMNLLLRMYNPPSGSVLNDGRDILHYPLLRLRQGIAYVPQDGFLFSTTLLENISFADDQADAVRVEASARLAEIHTSICQFSEGYATAIGERGVRLSGGQKQRVAIARMLYKDAQIRILDDSLSAVDTSTERALLANLRVLSTTENLSKAEKKIIIIISHRLSAVQKADHILVLDEGRVVEEGEHDALIRSGGGYAKLWALQSGQMPGTGAALPDDEEVISGTIVVPEDDPASTGEAVEEI